MTTGTASRTDEVRVINREFLKAGHLPTLLSSFLYFDMSFMVWVLLGALAVQISADLALNPAQKGFMVALPVLAGALLRVVFGVLVDKLGPRRAGIIGQAIVIAGLLCAWLVRIDSYQGTLALGLVLGVAGASFAVALPLASGWYPPKYQGIALGIAGAGNSGTVFASRFAPGLAQALGWNAVLGLAVIALGVAFLVYLFAAKDAPARPPAKRLAGYLEVLRTRDAWWLMFFYSVTFGGFVGLAASLAIYFNTDYGLDAVTAGYFTAACVFCGSLVRPVGGALADRFGGVRTLSMMYGIAAAMLVFVSFHPATVYAALALFAVAMLAFGMGNGSVFQLVPQRFRHEIGVMTGLVGMTGGVGGFFLASSLGLSKQLTGNYQAGLLVFASLAVAALLAISAIKQRWRATWTTAGVAGARI
jgi:NNP family nitrate/nitrite transporter-like MFS transporter